MSQFPITVAHLIPAGSMVDISMLGPVAARVLRALVLAVLEGVVLRAAAAAVAAVAAAVAAVADAEIMCSIINCWPLYEFFS